MPAYNKNVEPGRITTVQHVYYQGDGQSPIVSQSCYAQPSSRSEQPYIRKTNVGNEWTEIDKGWMKNPCLLLLTNMTYDWVTQPTAYELSEAAKLMLTVGVLNEGIVVPIAIVRPGQSLRLSCYDIDNLVYRCEHLSLETRVTITLLPE